jgi:hypothetical protein
MYCCAIPYSGADVKIQGKPREVVLPTAPPPARHEPILFDLARMAAAFRERRSGGSDPEQKLKPSA